MITTFVIFLAWSLFMGVPSFFLFLGARESFKDEQKRIVSTGKFNHQNTLITHSSKHPEMLEINSNVK
jgi:hypothetical protein